MLYRTLSVVDSGYPLHGQTLRILAEACLNSEPASFMRRHVRHIALTDVPTDAALSLLSICGETTSVAIFQKTPPNPAFLLLLAAMPLSRLAVGLTNLFGSQSTVDFGHAIFSRLTHLDIFETDWDSDDLVPGLACLPCLTHLSFNLELYGDDYLPELGLVDILTNCRSLEVLVLIIPDDTERRDADEYEYFADDVRAVTMVAGGFLEDWECGHTGGVDYWRVAETFIQKRKSGEIKVFDT
ncbi:hypothetical protein DFH06DRAFT_1223127 [Mycena polygramma]|nr:hypothetical protein DFH06DRAFT_1223127 [Mycena polygramma]